MGLENQSKLVKWGLQPLSRCKDQGLVNLCHGLQSSGRSQSKQVPSLTTCTTMLYNSYNRTCNFNSCLSSYFTVCSKKMMFCTEELYPHLPCQSSHYTIVSTGTTTKSKSSAYKYDPRRQRKDRAAVNLPALICGLYESIVLLFVPFHFMYLFMLCKCFVKKYCEVQLLEVFMRVLIMNNVRCSAIFTKNARKNVPSLQ